MWRIALPLLGSDRLRSIGKHRFNVVSNFVVQSSPRLTEGDTFFGNFDSPLKLPDSPCKPRRSSLSFGNFVLSDH
jgi:hypothetical protein